ncbi:MAG: class I SAM-dependent methyltransferase [Candidatus Hodarchaeota archaeon]
MVERAIESTMPNFTGRLLPPEEIYQETLAMDETFVRIVAEWLWEQFEHEGWGVGEAYNIADMVQTFEIKNDDLFQEALISVATSDYVAKEGDKFRFLKPAVGVSLDYLLNECPKDFGQSFPVFAKIFRAGLDKVLLGITQDSDPMTAEAWDRVLGNQFYVNDRHRAMEFGRLMDLRKDLDRPLKVLDWGCGTGICSIQIQQYLNENGIEHELYGYDPTPGVIDIAKSRIPSLSPYIFGRSEKEVVFDIVFVSHALHYIPNGQQQPTIALIDRICHSPGKFLGCALFSEPDFNPHVNTCIRVLGGPGVPSEAGFKSWFLGTNFKIRVDTCARVFCADK